MRRLFPSLRAFRFGHVNLDHEARCWNRTNEPNSLLDPETCRGFVEHVHRQHGIDASFGGWLEDRRVLWRGSYLDEDGRYLHLGVDINVPEATPVALPRRSEVLRSDDDHPEPFGWGTRLIVRPYGMDVAMILAHLAPRPPLRPGDPIEAGEIVGNVGGPARNGGWFPHLHVQLVTLRHFETLLADNLRDLDGYGCPKNPERLAILFPDPTPLLIDD